MGLLDQVTGAVGGHFGQQQGAGGGILGAVMQMINDPRTGGLSGLMDAFRQGGLGEVFNSWVSSGPNQPVSGQQLQGILGNERIQPVASQLGVSNEEASGQLAQYLPQVIDRLTPDGQLPEGGLLGKGMDALKGLLG